MIKSKRKTFMKNTLSTAVSMALIPLVLSTSQIAYAEEAEKTEEGEVIEIYGVRGSATKQLNSKRHAKNILDGIFAEDMGKMSDENIAEAMQRITGVGIEYIDGEGSQITIRGVEGSLNNVQLNGQTLTNTGDDNSVDFSAMSADMLKSIQVVKSPSANHDEGSLGGTVKLTTWRPLDIKKPIRRLSTQVKHNDLSGKNDYTVKASFGDNFMDEKVGVTASVFYDKVNTRLDKQTNYGWRFTNIAATDSVTGEDLGTIRSFEPVGIENNLKTIERARYGGTATIQYNLSNESSVWADLSYTRKDQRSLQHNLRVTGLRGNGGRNIWDAESGSSVVATAGNASGNILTRLQETESDTTVVSLNYQQQFFDDSWTLDSKLGWSNSNDYFPINRRLNYNAAGNRESVTTSWLNDDGSIRLGPTTTWDSEYATHWNPETLPLLQIWFDERDAKDDLYSFQLDFHGDVEYGPIVNMAMGLKHTQRTKSREQTAFNTSLPDGATEVLGDNSLPFPANNFFTRVSGIEGNPWPVPNMGPIFDEYFANPEVIQDHLGTAETYLETSAVYLMADYDFFDGLLLGDFGVRYVETTSTASGNSGYRFPTNADPSQITFPVEGTSKYSNVLPSFNGRFVVNDEMLVRFAAAKVMARPKQTKLTPGTNVNLVNRSNPRATGGNPDLKPTVANQYDISWEWYFQDTAMVSVAAFLKDFESLSYTKIEERTFPCPSEVTDLTLCALMIDMPTTLTVNGDGGEVSGVEVSYQQDFSFLPGFFKNFGTILNYTYADSEATFVDPEQDAETSDLLSGFPLQNTSKDTFNGTLYWENKAFSARLAYNYRSKSLRSPINRDGALWNDDRKTLDFSARYKVNKNLSFALAITNLTDSYNRIFVTRLKEDQDDGLFTEGNALDGNAPEWRTYGIDHSGRNFRLSATYKM